jgi:hypothetical protein
MNSTPRSNPAFWLQGWHRLWHRYEVQGSTGPVTDADRAARAKIAKRFTLAEWRFHRSLPRLGKKEQAVPITKPLQWEPYGEPTPHWGANGAFRLKYWARDNGLWETDPKNSGPLAEDVEKAQKAEDQRVLDALSPEATALLRHGTTPVTLAQHEELKSQLTKMTAYALALENRIAGKEPAKPTVGDSLAAYQATPEAAQNLIQKLMGILANGCPKCGHHIELKL